MKQDILNILAVRLRYVLNKLDYNNLMEIRLRSGGPLMILYKNQELFLGGSGEIVKEASKAFMVEQKDIKETLEYVSNYSRYAYEDEIRQGFITIRGGHRIELAKKALVSKGTVENLKNIFFLNIRMSHEKKGCAKKIMPYIATENMIRHTLLISPPGCGKTTLLRDMIRMVSNGDENRTGLTVGVVDERSEIGACYLGVPQNDVGTKEKVVNKDTAISSSKEKENNDRDVREQEMAQTNPETVLVEKEDGESAPYVVKEMNPEIAGVFVVAQGANNQAVVNQITDTVAVLFSVSVHKVKVMRMVADE